MLKLSTSYLDITKKIIFYLCINIIFFFLNIITYKNIPIGSISVFTAAYSCNIALLPIIILSIISILIFNVWNYLLYYLGFIAIFTCLVLILKPLVSIENRNEQYNLMPYIAITGFLLNIFCLYFIDIFIAIILNIVLYKLFTNIGKIILNLQNNFYYSKDEIILISAFTLAFIGFIGSVLKIDTSILSTLIYIYLPVIFGLYIFRLSYYSGIMYILNSLIYILICLGLSININMFYLTTLILSAAILNIIQIYFIEKIYNVYEEFKENIDVVQIDILRLKLNICTCIISFTIITLLLSLFLNYTFNYYLLIILFIYIFNLLKYNLNDNIDDNNFYLADVNKNILPGSCVKNEQQLNFYIDDFSHLNSNQKIKIFDIDKFNVFIPTLFNIQNINKLTFFENIKNNETIQKNLFYMIDINGYLNKKEFKDLFIKLNIFLNWDEQSVQNEILDLEKYLHLAIKITNENYNEEL